MSESVHHNPQLDRYTTMGDLTRNIRRVLRGALFPFGAVLGCATLYLIVQGSPGALAFAMMSGGALLALAVWCQQAAGVPLLPMIVVQQLVVCGLPILTGHEVVAAYPPSFLTQAGLEVFTFCASAVAFWRVGIALFHPGAPVAYTLVDIDRSGVTGLARLGFGMVIGSTAFLVLQSLDLIGFVFQVLPSGAYPLIAATVSATSACGFFLLSLIAGAGKLNPVARSAFWLLLAGNCIISASSLLLSAAAVVIASVVIGLFWSTGRIPWRFTLILAVCLSLFNMGKYPMRDRYWKVGDDEDMRPMTTNLSSLPGFYAEWMGCTWDALAGSHDATASNPAPKAKSDDQGLFERLNNLQNILFVIDAVQSNHIPTLDGQSYAVIPPLLVPRILWPSKPRTHEGQVMLNVHFGRQALESTFTTYVAWGLLAEAYGNFGPIKGVVLLGMALGLFFAWAEQFTCRKPLLSTEGFVAFAIFLGLANSYEMVASVMVTSIFQSLVPIIAACMPFVRRMTVVRPSAA